MKRSILFLWILPLSIGIACFSLGILVGITLDINSKIDWSIVRICLASLALLIALTPLYISLIKHIKSMRTTRRWVQIKTIQINQLLAPYDPRDGLNTGKEIKDKLHPDSRDVLIEFATECKDIPWLSKYEEDALERLLISIYSFVRPAIDSPEESLGKKSSKLRARLNTFQSAINAHYNSEND